MFGLSARFMPRVCRICKSESTAKVSLNTDLGTKIDVLTFNRAALRCAVVDARVCGIVAPNINEKTSITTKISVHKYFFFIHNF